MILIDWLVSNPSVWLPVVGAALTMILKPRSPEEYEAIAKVSPRLAAALKLLAALFPDLLKAWSVAKQLKDGTYVPADNKKGPDA